MGKENGSSNSVFRRRRRREKENGNLNSVFVFLKKKYGKRKLKLECIFSRRKTVATGVHAS